MSAPLQKIVPLPPTVQAPAATPEEQPRMSLFASCKATKPSGAFTLAELVDGVREGTWRVEVTECQDTHALDGVEAYKASRGSVPAVTLSAMFKTRDKDASPDEKGAVHSGLLQLDFDAKDHTGMAIDEIRSIVQAAPFVAACFLSISGEAVKGIARIPASIVTHPGSWEAARQYFTERGLTLDTATKDYTRLCFVSYDPEPYHNPDAEELEPAPVPEKSEYGEASGGTVRPEFAREILEEISQLWGRQEYPEWLKITSAACDGVGEETAIELMKECFPEEDDGEYERLVRSLRTFIPWDTLRTYRVNTTDPENFLKLLPDVSPEDPFRDAFPIFRAGESAGIAMVADFVESLLIEGAASVVYGQSNCGKSFWILDLAVCVATGANFRELEVDRGAVVYVVLEGTYGFKNRIEALKRAERFPEDTPLYFIEVPVSLLQPKHADKLAASVKKVAAESGLPCRLVIIDTLARAMAGGDENSGKDMTAAVKQIDAIRAATGAHVCVVHHCGKDEARGARGHSSLRAAVDTEIEVSRPEGETITTVRVSKQRDLPTVEPMPFSLKTVVLGVNQRGKPVTSCTVHHEDASMARKTRKAGRVPKYAPEDLLRFLPAATVKEWLGKAKEEAGISASTFYELKKRLETSERIEQETSTKQIIATPDSDNSDNSNLEFLE